MDISKIKKKAVFVCSVLIALIIIPVCDYGMKRLFFAKEVLQMEISLNSGFYSDKQKVEVQVPKGATVYYTDDCTEPSKEKGICFQAPISIVPDVEERVYVYRFKAYYANGEESDVITRTYFVGTEIASRYTTNVLHLTGEPDDLFGYENGIFVGGKLLDEFVAANPDAHFGGGVDANFTLRGRDAEREVYIEAFARDGSVLLAQAGG